MRGTCHAYERSMNKPALFVLTLAMSAAVAPWMSACSSTNGDSDPPALHHEGGSWQDHQWEAGNYFGGPCNDPIWCDSGASPDAPDASVPRVDDAASDGGDGHVIEDAASADEDADLPDDDAGHADDEDDSGLARLDAGDAGMTAPGDAGKRCGRGRRHRDGGCRR